LESMSNVELKYTLGEYIIRLEQFGIYTKSWLGSGCVTKGTYEDICRFVVELLNRKYTFHPSTSMLRGRETYWASEGFHQYTGDEEMVISADGRVCGTDQDERESGLWFISVCPVSFGS